METLGGKLSPILQEMAVFVVQHDGPVGFTKEDLQYTLALFVAAALDVAYDNVKPLPDAEKFGRDMIELVKGFTGVDLTPKTTDI
jgi:hypothetical protein